MRLFGFGGDTDRIPSPSASSAPLASEGGALALRLVQGFEAQGSGWLWETDRTGRLTYLSDKVVRQVGGDAGVIGRPLTEIFELNGDDTGERTLLFHLNARASFADYEVSQSGSDNDERRWSISGRPWFDGIGQFRGFVGSGCDLTDKRRSEAEISRLAMFDSLTGLANRAQMRRALGQALGKRQGSYRPTALLLLDLDRFKTVNDTLGHQIGDLLLQQVAARLTRTVGEDGLVGRLGGDEFEVILPGGANRDKLSELADSIIATLSHPYFIDDSYVSIGCSIGIALSPADGDDTATLTRNADLALYSAKANGRGTHRFFRESLLVEAQTRKLLEDDLRQALARQQLHLVYQPVVSTRTAQVVGYEALIRWDHPVRGAISPADFIPIAEESGLIEQIGEWVMRTACDTAATLPASIRMAVNVSPIQFAKPSLPAIVASAIANSGLPPDRLELEITEGVFLDGSRSTEQMFTALKRIGVRLALDDFGTGYSSLGYLRTAPFDKIKIDQSFVRGAKIAGSRNAAIIKAIVTLADTLELETTAEGVEAQDEIELIRALGCSHIQGYVYGRPLPASGLPRDTGEAAAIEPVGVKFTRSPRTTMLRSIMVLNGDRRGTARIRNISSSGAMIDSIDGIEMSPGTGIMIEVFGEQREGFVRWTDDGRAGVAFTHPIDLARLLAEPGERRGKPRAVAARA